MYNNKEPPKSIFKFFEGPYIIGLEELWLWQEPPSLEVFGASLCLGHVWAVFVVIPKGGFPKIRGMFWSPYNKDPTIQGAILGSAIFGQK